MSIAVPAAAPTAQDRPNPPATSGHGQLPAPADELEEVEVGPQQEGTPC